MIMSIIIIIMILKIGAVKKFGVEKIDKIYR
jgi:hypothetical protein